METENAAPARKAGAKGIIAAVAALIIIAGGYYAYTKGLMPFAGGGSTVAVVNGTDIKEKELNRRFEQLKLFYESQGGTINAASTTEIRKGLADELVNEELVVQHATSKGIAASDEEIETAYGQLQARFENEAAFKDELEKFNYTERELKANVRREIVINKFIAQYAAEQNVAASEQEIAELYASLSAGQTGVPQLSEVRDSVEQEVKKRKLEQKIAELVAGLKSQASVEILI